MQTPTDAGVPAERSPDRINAGSPRHTRCSILAMATGSFVRRASLGSVIALATLLAVPSASARLAPLFVTVDARVPVRVQIALAPSHALPCDSSDNTMVFDGMVAPGVGLRNLSTSVRQPMREFTEQLRRS